MLFWLGCSGDIAPREPLQPVEVLESFPWEPVWPTTDQAYFVANSSLRLVSVQGVQELGSSGPCGSGKRVESAEKLVAGLEKGASTSFPKAAANEAVVVERVGWRLADALGEPTGLIPGGSNADPTLYKGVRVRTARKTRRPGAPPVMIAVGHRRDEVVVGMLSRDGSELLDSHLIKMPKDWWEAAWALPVTDLDSDGVDDLVVWGSHNNEVHFRALYSVDLVAKRFTFRGISFAAPVDCQ